MSLSVSSTAVAVDTIRDTKPKEWGFTLPLKARSKVSKHRKWGLTLPFKAKIPSQIKPRELSIPHLKVRSSARHKPSNEQGLTLPLRKNLSRQLVTARPLDKHLTTIVALLGVQLISYPSNCTIKVGRTKVPLEPFTEQHLTELRSALSKKTNSVSVLFKF